MEIKHVNARPTSTQESQRTVVWVDPRDRTCGVYVKRATEGTTIDAHYNIVLEHHLNFHPHEETLRQWFTGSAEALDRICDGHEVVWTGSNHVGRLSDEAASTWDMLVEVLNGYSDDPGNYAIWDVRDWMQFVDVRANMTDAELAQIAEESTPLESDSDIVVGDILEHLQAVRAARRDEGGWDD